MSRRMPPTPMTAFSAQSCPRCQATAWGQIMLQVDTHIFAHRQSWHCKAQSDNSCACSCPHPDAAKATQGCQELETLGKKRTVGNQCSALTTAAPTPSPTLTGAAANQMDQLNSLFGLF